MFVLGFDNWLAISVYITFMLRIWKCTAYPNSIRRFFILNMKELNRKKLWNILGEQRISGNTQRFKPLLKNVSVKWKPKQCYVFFCLQHVGDRFLLETLISSFRNYLRERTIKCLWILWIVSKSPLNNWFRISTLFIRLLKA